MKRPSLRLLFLPAAFLAPLAVVRVCHPAADPPRTALTRQFRFVPRDAHEWVPVRLYR